VEADSMAELERLLAVAGQATTTDPTDR
jgi:hypothetical protein